MALPGAYVHGKALCAGDRPAYPWEEDRTPGAGGGQPALGTVTLCEGERAEHHPGPRATLLATTLPAQPSLCTLPSPQPQDLNPCSHVLCSSVTQAPHPVTKQM